MVSEKLQIVLSDIGVDGKTESCCVALVCPGHSRIGRWPCPESVLPSSRAQRDSSWETLPLPACCSPCRAPFNTAFVKKDAPGSSPGIKEAKARGMPGTVLEKQVRLAWKCHADELPFFTSDKEHPRAIMENTQALPF